jgi:hypothetical protein
LLVRRAHIAAINAQRDRTIWKRLSLRVLFRALEQIELPFLTQLLLDAFRRCLQVIADRLRIGRIANRQHVLASLSL